MEDIKLNMDKLNAMINFIANEQNQSIIREEPFAYYTELRTIESFLGPIYNKHFYVCEDVAFQEKFANALVFVHEMIKETLPNPTRKRSSRTTFLP